MLCTAHLHPKEDVNCHQGYVCNTVKLSPTEFTAVQAAVCSAKLSVLQVRHETWFFDVKALSLRGATYATTDLCD